MTPVSLGDIPDTLQKLEDTYIIKFDTKADQNKARFHTIDSTFIERVQVEHFLTKSSSESKL